MQVNISIEGEELTLKKAARQLRQIADMIQGGTVHMMGYNVEANGEFSIDVDFGDIWPHGDYQDGEGNLVHVANDTVVNVTWANKDAEIEEVEIPGHLWVKEHGPLHPAGTGHDHDDHDHE